MNFNWSSTKIATCKHQIYLPMQWQADLLRACREKYHIISRHRRFADSATHIHKALKNTLFYFIIIKPPQNNKILVQTKNRLSIENHYLLTQQLLGHRMSLVANLTKAHQSFEHWKLYGELEFQDHPNLWGWPYTGILIVDPLAGNQSNGTFLSCKDKDWTQFDDQGMSKHFSFLRVLQHFNS